MDHGMIRQERDGPWNDRPISPYKPTAKAAGTIIENPSLHYVRFQFENTKFSAA